MTENPTGHILVNGSPMAFWLPEGQAPEDLRLQSVSNDNHQIDLEDCIREKQAEDDADALPPF